MNDPPYTLDDFGKQMEMISRLGGWAGIAKPYPRLRHVFRRYRDSPSTAEVRRIAAMIGSMTPDERRDPGRVDEERRRRIARGSGASVDEVQLLLTDFEMMRRMMLRRL